MSEIKNVVIRRLESSEDCTKGVLTIDGRYICMTLELPWRDNKPNASCIPIGMYVCGRVKSDKFGDTYTVRDVPGRSYILFHAGNRPVDSTGCILLGRTLQPTTCLIVESRKGLESFMKALDNAQFFQLFVVE